MIAACMGWSSIVTQTITAIDSITSVARMNASTVDVVCCCGMHGVCETLCVFQSCLVHELS